MTKQRPATVRQRKRRKGALTPVMVGRHRPIEQRQPERRRRLVGVYVCASVCVWVHACVICLQYTIIILDPG